MTSLSSAYDRLLDEGIPITELYIYHLIISDDRTYGYTSQEINETVEEVLQARYILADLSLENIIDKILNGETFNGDDETWDLY